MQKLSLGAGDLAELAADVLENDGRLLFRASGSSMLPTLRDGDLLCVVPFDADSLHPGDILLYTGQDGGAVVHRYSGTNDGEGASRLMMSCDARPWSRYGIDADRVLGTVVSAFRTEIPLRLEFSPLSRLKSMLLVSVRWSGTVCRKAVCMCMSAAASVGFLRRGLRLVLKPLVRYRVIPSDPDATGSGDMCTREEFRASVAGRTVGSASLVKYAPGTPFSGRQWLFGMRVSTAFRGAGIGRELARMVMERASLSGDESLCLIVDPDNHRALELYSSLGFTDLELSGSDEGLSGRLEPGNRVMVLRMD
jgi:GNAT superfamily N-acetyltransferase